MRLSYLIFKHKSNCRRLVDNLLFLFFFVSPSSFYTLHFTHSTTATRFCNSFYLSLIYLTDALCIKYGPYRLSCILINCSRLTTHFFTASLWWYSGISINNVHLLWSSRSIPTLNRNSRFFLFFFLSCSLVLCVCSIRENTHHISLNTFHHWL